MKSILNTCCMSLRDWCEMFRLALQCTLCFLLASFMSAPEYLSSWVTSPQPYIQLTIFFFFFCIHCLSLSIANNSKWVFFIHRTLERRVKRRKKHMSKLEAYARRQRELGKPLQITKEIGGRTVREG